MKTESLKMLGLILIILIGLGTVFHLLGYGYVIACSITAVTMIPIVWKLKTWYEQLKQ